jgi:oligopeptide transport system ATP-binding protein
VLNLLRDIRASTGVAYVFISHDLAVVRQIADRTIVLRRGRIVEQGPTDQVLDHPRHEFTRTLLAAVPGPGWSPRRWHRTSASPDL